LSDPNILDEYGNNAAIRCPSCGGVFVFSKHINEKSGRVCPHCHRAKATVSAGKVEVELIVVEAIDK
jgi:Zn finger protein HypA/HybF involved in hydrogenase expression